jgi:hypothetical protein
MKVGIAIPIKQAIGASEIPVVSECPSSPSSGVLGLLKNAVIGMLNK